MRKWLCSLLLILVFSGLSYAEEQPLDVSVYEQGLVLNGFALDITAVKYPLLHYKDVVYLPLSTEMGSAAGFVLDWNDATRTLTVGKNAPVSGQLKGGLYTHPKTATAVVSDVTVNFGNEPLGSEEYPILNCSDVTYVPLTWDVINRKMGWKSSYHPLMGLVIQSDGVKIDAVLSSFNLQYYDALASFILTRNKGYSHESALETVRMIKANADLHGIDEKLVMALWWQESTFNSSSVSSHGALGAMQIMPDTGERLGYTREQLMDPKYNVEGGTRYLAGLRDTFNGDMFLAVSAYNQGSTRVSRGSFSRSFATDVFEKYDKINAYVQEKAAQ